MRVVQLVTCLKPSQDGISDYAIAIAQKLIDQYNTPTDFIVYERGSKIAREELQNIINDFSITKLPKQKANSLLPLLSESMTHLVVHYCFRDHYNNPIWMFKLLQFTRKIRQFKLIIILHEITTKYKKKGITLPALRHLYTAYRVFNLADLVVVNNAKNRDIVSQYSKTSVVSFPNFSTIGEPLGVPPLRERKPYLIILGTKASRPYLYKNFLQNVIYVCRLFKIEEIYDIGTPFDLPREKLEEIPITAMGVQPKEVVSKLLLDSRMAFLDYSRFPKGLGASTLFATYCSHGLVTILSTNNPCQADGLEINKHYLVSDDKDLKAPDLDQLQQIADNAHTWYQGHNLSKFTEFLGNYILN